MWWLSFRDGSAVAIQASSLVHARLLAAAHGLGRASQFVDGYFFQPTLAAMIPNDCVGRILAREEAWQLYDRLEREWAPGRALLFVPGASAPPMHQLK